jgi:PAS domain S-box-containing protein
VGTGGDPARVLGALSEALFTYNPDLVWDVDLHGFVRRVNGRVTELLGYVPDDVVGWHVREIVLPEDMPDAARSFDAALAGRAATTTCRMRHRDGRTVAVHASVIPLVIDGAVRAVYVGCRDVTEALAQAAELAERTALYELLVEQSPECVAVFQDGRYVYVNPAGARMSGAGYGPADVVGRDALDFVAPADRARIAAEYAAVLASPGAPRPVEKRLVADDGRVFDVEGTLTGVQFRGRPAVHSFTRDVTARRRAEGERLRTQRLEALGRLAASVAHDFNNLLAVMLAAVEQAGEVVPDDAELKADLAEAAGAARRGRALTRQLLTFAKQEETRPQLLDVNARVLAMQELLRRLAGSRAEVTLALAPDAGVVLADPSQLDQVLLNLVTNARDAMPGGGRVHVETAREDGSVRLTVRDTGAGIAPEVRPHLFEPFFTTKAEGHGLGLSTVYGVVTGAGGRVEVESEPGQGAAFHLWLPRAG